MGYEAEKVITAELAPGEKLVWAGRPRRGIRLTAADLLLVPLSLVWCGFAVFWEMTVLKQGGPDFFALFGLIFVAAGIYIVVGRFFADAIRRSKTFYGVTTQRAIIVSGIFSRNVKSLELSSLGGLSLSEQRDRSGTITLGPPSGLYAWAAGLAGPSWPGAARYLPPAFEMIENARQVHEQIRSIQARDR
jgi:hypothetical protein